MSEYETSFTRLMQLKTEQRLNQTSFEANEQALVSSILMGGDMGLLKPLFNLARFHGSYLQHHRDSEYQALGVVLESMETRLSESSVMVPPVGLIIPCRKISARGSLQQANLAARAENAAAPDGTVDGARRRRSVGTGAEPQDQLEGEFLAQHWDLIVAADSLTVEVWTAKGLQRFVVLFFIELSTRRVEIGGVPLRSSSIALVG